MKGRITRPFELDLGGSSLDRIQIFRGQFNVQCSEVLIQPVELRRAGNGNNPGLLRQQPRECDLRRCCFLLFRKASDQVNQNLIGLPILPFETRDLASKIAALELGLRRDLPSQETFSQKG
jgi:hypothetical protein